MKKLIAIALLAFGLGACTQFQNAFSIVTGTSVSPGAIIVSGYSVDALETAASLYLKRPRCGTPGIVLCRQSSATIPLKNAIHSMRVARNAAEDFLASHPGQLGTSGAYDALTASAAALKQILDQYAVTIGG